MKKNSPSQPGRSPGGFTLIEVIGVLAVCSLVALILVPRVIATIEDTTVSGTVQNLRAVQVAAVEYFGKYGRFGDIAGRPLALPVKSWDAVLVAENFLDQPFQSRLGANGVIEIVRARDLKADQGIAFVLEGSRPLPEDSIVVKATIENVLLADAWKLSQQLDGAPGSAFSREDSADELGRVVYCLNKSDSAGSHHLPLGDDQDAACGEVTVHVYLAHY